MLSNREDDDGSATAGALDPERPSGSLAGPAREVGIWAALVTMTRVHGFERGWDLDFRRI